MPNRRHFLRTAALGAPLAAPLFGASAALAAEPSTSEPSTATDAPARRIVKPPRLKPGDTVGLVAPAGTVYEQGTVDRAAERVEALGLKAEVGRHVLDRYGYLAGRDENRAADLNTFFRDDAVDAILCLRGGWGCARLLPHLDMDAVRANPKLLVGYSDVTALLLACYAQAGLVTVHGPTGVSTWNTFSVDHFRRLLFDAEAFAFENPVRTDDRLVQTRDRTTTIVPGKGRGRLVGGNLTVLSALVGTPYMPSFDGHILFLEDIGESVYRIDRMLTQLALAGLLDGLAGFVFGKCTDCEAGSGAYGSLTFEEVLKDHLAPRGIPSYEGAMIGHITDKFSVPLGVEAEIDADAGTITLLESAVA